MRVQRLKVIDTRTLKTSRTVLQESFVSPDRKATVLDSALVETASRSRRRL